MRSGRRWASTAVAGIVSIAVVAATAVFAVLPAEAAATSPFDPSASGATRGTISFYDASGNQITHGPLATPPAYAAADTFNGRAGDTYATLYNYTPEKALTSNAWTGFGLSTPATIPATGLPGSLAGTPRAVASGIALWYDNAAGVPSALPNINTDPAWQGLYQIRLYTSGPGQSIDSTIYPSATIAVDVTAGEWTQVYPTPSVSLTSTSVTAPSPSVASPVNPGTSVTFTSVATATGGAHPAGTIQFKEGSTNVGTAVAVDGSGSATSAPLTPTSGTRSYTAVFTPTDAATYSSSTSSATSFSVNSAPADSTTTTIGTISPAASADTSSPIHIAVAVHDATTSATVPTGTVTVKADGTAVATATLDSTGQATATVPASVLSVGAHTLTADFSPTGNFAASTTAAGTPYSITLAGPANVTAPTASAAKVGVASTCNPGVWTYAGTYAFAWYLDSSVTPFSTSARTAVLPATYAGHTVTCKVTVSNPSGAVTVAAAGAKVAVGSAPRNTVKPTIVGLIKGFAVVGRTVKAKVGSWSPSPAGYGYQWKINGKVVSRATAVKISKAWKGKTLVLVITTVKAGYASGLAVSNAAKVK